MRASKLRLPESTAQATRSPSAIARETSSGSGPGVADAGRAAVADRVEAELVEVALETGALVVVGDDPRAWRERRLHPRPAPQTELDRLLREQAGADHHLRVRGVRAGRDRRDHDRAVVERELLAVERDTNAMARGRMRDRHGRRLRVVLVPAGRLLGRRIAGRERLGERAVLVDDAERVERLAERLLRPAERHAVLRPPRPGERRLDRRRGRARRPASTSGCAPGSCQSRFSLQ